MSGYLERLIRRGLGRAGAATLRPRADGPPAEELPGAPISGALELGMTEEAPAGPLAGNRPQPPRAASPAAVGAADDRIRPRAESAVRGTPGTAAARTSSASTPKEAPPPQTAAGRRSGEREAPPVASRERPVPAAIVPMPSLPSAPPPESTAPVSGRPADRDRPTAIGVSTAGSAGATAREAITTQPEPSRPTAERPLDRAEVESLATAVVARRLTAAEPELLPPWSTPRRRGEDLRFDGDGERRIEVHIDRVEVVQEAPPPPPPAAPPTRPRHRGFAELAATRHYQDRRWY